MRIDVHRPQAWSNHERVAAQLAAANEEGTVFLFSAGMSSKVWIGELLKQGKQITCIDLGSALDPLYLGRTRSGQPSKGEALTFFWRAGFHP
jgi:hypothetical protein